MKDLELEPSCPEQGWLGAAAEALPSEPQDLSRQGQPYISVIVSKPKRCTEILLGQNGKI